MNGQQQPSQNSYESKTLNSRKKPQIVIQKNQGKSVQSNFAKR